MKTLTFKNIFHLISKYSRLNFMELYIEQGSANYSL